jgi:hypothetical protein
MFDRGMIDQVKGSPADVLTGVGPEIHHRPDRLGFEDGVVIDKADEVDAGGNVLQAAVSLPGCGGRNASDIPRRKSRLPDEIFGKGNVAAVDEDEFIGNSGLNAEALEQPP